MKNAPQPKRAEAVGSTRLVSPVSSQSESAEAYSFPRTVDLPSSAYKDGHLTFSGIVMTPATCRISFRNWFAGRTPQLCRWGKISVVPLETGWISEALGHVPPQGLQIGLLDYSLGAICECFRLTTRISHEGSASTAPECATSLNASSIGSIRWFCGPTFVCALPITVPFPGFKPLSCKERRSLRRERREKTNKHILNTNQLV